MLWHRIRGVNHAYYCILAILVSGFFWLYLTFLGYLLGPTDGYEYTRYVIYNLAAVSALAFAALNGRQKIQQLLRCDLISNHQLATYNMSCVAAGILVVLAATRDRAISRLFLFTFLPLLYVLLFFCHRFIPRVLVRTFFSNGRLQKALLVGPLDKAEKIEKWCAQMLELGMEASCFFPGLNGSHDSSPASVSTGLTDLERIVRRERIAQIILLELPPRREDLSGIVMICNRLGSRLLVVDDLPELLRGSVTHCRLWGLDFITTMEEPLEDPLNRLVKRTIDLAMSALVVVLVVPPLALLVAIMQRFQSPGPLFCRQTRSGMANKPFRIFKFRTMHPSLRSVARQATLNDNRIYPFGRWLRRMSLDEVPQFINVLRGEMSVVGPRPHMIVHNRRFTEIMNSYHVRAFVKPGITGAAQVKGHRGEARTKESISERVKLDIQYIETWSLWRDLAIILKTTKEVLFPPRSAY
jgi:exopolysaccharide biosynthesis polyprenyl glycosylphosphotransferase